MPDSRIINQHEWRVVGMSRSGSHAIIHWLQEQCQGRVCFLNCAEPKSNPFCTARPLGPTGSHCANYPEFDLALECGGRLSRKDYLIYSHEDCFLGMLRRGSWEDSHDTWIGRSASRRDILILRDPFNLFASRLKIGFSHMTPHTATRIWKQHAREFLGRTRLLPNAPVRIAYNRWVLDAAYRRQLTADLGFTPCGASFETVPRTAGGSSFDGLRYRRKASRMKVFDRWRQFADDPHYQKIFDAEMVELAEEIFGASAASRHEYFCRL